MCCLVIFVYWGNIPRTSHLECLKTAPRRQVAFLPPCLLHFCGLFLKKEKRNLALAVPVKKIKKVTAKHRLTPEQKFHSGSIFLASLFFFVFLQQKCCFVLMCVEEEERPPTRTKVAKCVYRGVSSAPAKPHEGLCICSANLRRVDLAWSRRRLVSGQLTRTQDQTCSAGGAFRSRPSLQRLTVTSDLPQRGQALTPSLETT